MSDVRQECLLHLSSLRSHVSLFTSHSLLTIHHSRPHHMSTLIIEGFGYLASLLLALSLMVNNDLRFRWLNSGGCVAFIIYGVLINAIPIILTNTGLLLINLY